MRAVIGEAGRDIGITPKGIPRRIIAVITNEEGGAIRELPVGILGIQTENMPGTVGEGS